MGRLIVKADNRHHHAMPRRADLARRISHARTGTEPHACGPADCSCRTVECGNACALGRVSWEELLLTQPAK
jgi:hypothetical protein